MSEERLGRGTMNFNTVPAPNENRDISFDIETAPIDGAADLFDPDSVKLGNLKDEEKIAAKIEEARAAFADRLALSPVTGRILSIGFKGFGVEGTQLNHAIDADEEARLIEMFFHMYTVHPGAGVAGYHILGFDLPFIYHRARALGLDCRRKIEYKVIKHRTIDVYKELTFWMYDTKSMFPSPAGRLENMAKSFIDPATGESLASPLRANQSESAEYAADLLSGEEDRVLKAENHLTADLDENHALLLRL